jgi:predicted component of type VI protein secretion system
MAVSGNGGTFGGQFEIGERGASTFAIPPFRVVVVGGFGLPEGRLHTMDDTGVAGLMEPHGPGLDFVVENHLGDAGEPLRFRIDFRSHRDFEPRRLVESVAYLSQAMALRDALRAGRKPDASLLGAVDLWALRSTETAIAAPAPPEDPSTAPTTSSPRSVIPNPDPATEPSEDEDPLDRILGMVDTSTPSCSDTPAATSHPEDHTARRAVGAFVSSVSRSRAPAAPGEAEAGHVERAIAKQLSAIVDDPAFRRLDTAWSALRFLGRRTDARSNVVIEVLEATKDTAAEALRRALVDDADQVGPGLGLILVTHDYGSNTGDVAAIQALGEIGETIQVPVVLSARNNFIRDVDGAKLVTLRDPETLFDNTGYEAWSSLRSKSCAQWIALGFNRIILRPSHDLTADRKFSFAAGDAPVIVGEPMEVGAALGIASVICESLAKHEWPTEITGNGGRIENLTLYSVSENANRAPLAVEIPLTTMGADSLANAGLLVLGGQPNRDSAQIIRAVTIAADGGNSAEGAGRAGNLGFQLLLSRLIRLLENNYDKILTETSLEARRQTLERLFKSLIAGTGHGASASAALEASSDERDPSNILELRITTGASILGGTEVVLEVPI